MLLGAFVSAGKYIRFKIGGPIHAGWLENGLLAIEVGQESIVGEKVNVVAELELASHTNKVIPAMKSLQAFGGESTVDMLGLKFTLNDTRH